MDGYLRERSRCKAFTLAELVVTLAIGVLVIFTMGRLLYNSQRMWHTMYRRVQGEAAIDTFVAQTVFESTVRRASKRYCWLDPEGQALRLYYYADDTSSTPDRYADFHVANGTLLVRHGDLTFGRWGTRYSPVDRLVDNVKSVLFSVSGTSVQMTLELADTSESRLVSCSAVRHCP